MFKLTLPDRVLRKMNRKEYYAEMHWSRTCRRAIEKKIDWSVVREASVDLARYGNCCIPYDRLLLC